MANRISRAEQSLSFMAVALTTVAVSACAGIDGGQSVAPEPAWQLAWSDEFDGAAIDAGKWELAFDCSDHGNGEFQCYTARDKNATIDDGVLHIIAREEEFSGPPLSADHPDYDINDKSKTKSYTSARLRSKNRFDFKYGRVEVRARLAGGLGMWPAIWMLPTESVYGGWPSSGEIDIMEAVRLDVPGEKNKIHGSLHNGLKWPQWSAPGEYYESKRSYTREFHNFIIEWEADEIRWFVDDVHYATQTSAGWYNYIWGGQEAGFVVANPRAPFDQEFHLLLNLAVGGHWPGQPDSNWPRQREMLIDYVRIYQCGSGNADGRGCASSPGARIDPSLALTVDAGAPKVNRFPILSDGSAGWQLNFPTGTKPQPLKAGSSGETAAIATRDVGAARGQVLAIDFSGAGAIFLNSADSAGGLFNLVGGTAWTNSGTLEFDLRVDSIEAGTRLVAGFDDAAAYRARYPIDTPPVGEWTHVAIRISDLLSDRQAGGQGIDLENILSLAVIEATGGSRATILLDNITLTCAVNGKPKNWQWDTACSVEPKAGAN